MGTTDLLAEITTSSSLFAVVVSLLLASCANITVCSNIDSTNRLNTDFFIIRTRYFVRVFTNLSFFTLNILDYKD